MGEGGDQGCRTDSMSNALLLRTTFSHGVVAPVVRACRQARLKTSPYLNARGKAVWVVEGDLVCGVPADVDEAGGNACYGGRDR